MKWKMADARKTHGFLIGHEREMFVKVMKWKLVDARKCLVVVFPEAAKE